MDWLEALLLGLVQGITEFLPVSSDGHLAVAQQVFPLLGGTVRPPSEDVFVDVMLHFGTVLAILVFYRRIALDAARGLLGSADVPAGFDRRSLIRIGTLVFVALLPLIPDKLFFMDMMEEAFHNPVAVGLGFLVTAAALIVTLRLPGGTRGPAQTTHLDALLIGVAQAFAPLPGVSRSGLTIAMALALGLDRAWAVGFSLLIAVPAILGAVVFKIKDVDAHTLTTVRMEQIALATVVAGVVGYAAIVWLIRIVRRGRLWYFSVYLVVLGLSVLLILPRLRERTDAQRPSTLDRSVRGAGAAAAPGAWREGSVGDVGRAHVGGARPAGV